ncbi:MAG: hypothetical protein FWC23_02095 [Chitinispirillia bacterium]|nr:hypothetical protein [Chitinispirillia bacterium]MCL2267970.1 hypothetical protein [Chitinispirillia bacterium]
MRHGGSILKGLSVIAAAVAMASAQVPNIGWYGAADTIYYITTADQLLGLAHIVNGTAQGVARDDFAGRTVELTQYIDLSEYTNWIPIGRTAGNAFAGRFDGGRHVISNLHINRPDSSYQGLFGWISGGSVERLGLEGVNISGGASTGAVAGYLDNGFVTDCYTTGTIRSADGAGGVAGSAARGSGIVTCYSTVAVTGGGSLGGVVGAIDNSNVLKCAALNPEVRRDSYLSSIGRVAGRNTGGTLSDNVGYAGMGNSNSDTVWLNKGMWALDGEDINLAAIKVDSTIGARFLDTIWITGKGKLPGFATPVDLPTHLNTIYRVSISPSFGLLIAKGKSRHFTVSVIGDNASKAVTWKVSGASSVIAANGQLTVGANETADTILVIAKSVADSTVSDTVTVTVVDASWYNTTAKSFEISSDIALAGLAAIVNGTWGGTPAIDNFSGKTVRLTKDIDLSRYKNWIPVGNSPADSSDAGRVFAGTFNGNERAVKNLTINRPNGNDYNGQYTSFQGLFGHVANGGRVDSLGVVGANIKGSFAAAAVVGRLLDSSTVNNCYSTGVISGVGAAGGIAGAVQLNSSVTNSYSAASVSGSGAGGVVGTLIQSILFNSYSSGAVSGSDTVGGVVGRVLGASLVENCAALNPKVEAAGAIVGRVAGSIDNAAIDSLKYNAAFAGMLNRAGNSVWANKGPSAADGEDVTLSDIRIDPSIGGRFTGINGWMTDTDRMPGLGGVALEFPEHFGPIVYDVSVSPAEATVVLGRTQQFTADLSVHNNAPATVTWTLSGTGLHEGTTINSDGLLTVAIDDMSASFRVIATSTLDNTRRGMAVVTLAPPPLEGIILISGMTGERPRAGEMLTGTLFCTRAVVGELSYSWVIDSTEIAAAAYTVTEEDIGKAITLVITSDFETGSVSKTIGAVDSVNAIINAARPIILVQPAGDTVKVDTAYILSVVAFGGGELSYRWYKADNETGAGGKAIDSATLVSYTIPLDSLGSYYYYVVVTNTIEDNKDGGRKTASDTSKVVMVTVVELPTAVASPNRVIPPNIEDAAVVAPVKAITSGFTAGPNPLGRSSGAVNFYRQGGWIKSGELTIYDASGNVINKISVRDNAVGALRAAPLHPDGQSRRVIGTWDFTDIKGRHVSEGTYLVRGLIITIDGKKERVSQKIGVR